MRAGLAAVALLALVPGDAQAGRLELRASVTPQVVSFPETTSLAYRLEMSTGAERETFSVTTKPVWQFGIDRGEPEGAILGPQEFPPVVEGEAVVKILE